jgi:hypothetical protein
MECKDQRLKIKMTDKMSNRTAAAREAARWKFGFILRFAI